MIFGATIRVEEMKPAVKLTDLQNWRQSGGGFIKLLKLAVFLRPYKKECILGPAFKLLEAIFELLLPTIMALIINNGVDLHNSKVVFQLGAVMLLLAVLGFGSSLICQYFAARASQGFGTSLRNALFKQISSFSHQEIDAFGTATLVNRITNDVNQLQLAVAMLIRLVIRAPFICIGAIIMAMILDFRLALIFLAVTPVFIVILYFVINRSAPLYRQYQQLLDRLALILGENLAGVRGIRAFDRTESEKQRFDQANDALTETAIQVGRLSALLNPMTLFVMNAAIIAILWIAGFHINSGTLSHGAIIAFVNYITQILLALIVVSNLVIIFTRAFTSAGRINAVLATTSAIPDQGQPDRVVTRPEAPAVAFREVSFAYQQSDLMVLEDISVTIQKGETVGIIGSTGAGKSTLVNLIPRFYDITRGEISVNGINVKNYSLDELRGKIAMVPQQAQLFSGTIADNIRWGKQDATAAEIRTAARIAQAEGFILQLPEGYNTQVSRGGLNFSGGQQQRLTIARAIIAMPEILILDDASSALDFATDAALRQALNDSCRNMTVLMVSQRAGTLRQADRIIVLDDRRLAGYGTHQELMNSCAVYQEICRTQFSDGEVCS
jgi:ATP-binding cassette subfamily B protein